MSRSRARLAADWFAKLRQNAVTQEVEHTDVVAAEAAAAAEAEAVSVAAAASMEAALDGKAPTSHTHDYVPERSRSDWNDGTVVNDVIGQIAWQNYGSNHTIFDASKSLSPSGTSVNNTNSTSTWSATYPTLMGWNGSKTYGVRVDTARYANSAGSVSPPAAGTVGSYALLRAKSSSTKTYPNNNVAGSTMSYADTDWNQYSTPAGTWRCMGYAVARTRPTVYLRIS